MSQRTPIGPSDFAKLRAMGAHYVDRTGFVAEVLADPTEVLLFPRPRRFGKTLNLTTLRYFLERVGEDRSPLFEDLAIWQDVAARAHFGRYPVVFLTFKDARAPDWGRCRERLAGAVAEAFKAKRWLLDGDALRRDEREAFERVLRRQAGPAELEDGLRLLTAWLARATGEQAVVLVDEYDTPVHSGFARGYYDEVVDFFRTFLSGGLKDNPHLFKGVLTGVLRVAKESLFSGLNNLAVHSLLSRYYSTAFGFTEEEVAALCEAAGSAERLEEVRSWYDGYLFGGRVVYNPWSVLNYLAHPDNGFLPYWVAAGSDDVLRELLVRQGLDERGALEALLSGERVERPVVDDIVLRDVQERPGAVWSFLVFSGYLKAEEVECADEERTASPALYRLAIPNREVRQAYGRVFFEWLQESAGGGERVRRLAGALLAGDEATFGSHLSDVLRTHLSYHDVGGREAERVYQALIVGLLVHLEPRYEVRSNRESGYGRYDVMLAPRRPGRPGVVLELKVLDTPSEETPDTALDSALAQIRERDYAADLRDRGAEPVHELAAVFDGKRAWVRAA